MYINHTWPIIPAACQYYAQNLTIAPFVTLKGPKDAHFLIEALHFVWKEHSYPTEKIPKIPDL